MDTASASGTGGTTEQKDEKMDATTPADTTTPTADTKTTDGGAASGGGGATPTPDTPPLMMDGKECLPFQLQISYTSLDGAQCNRVITQAKPITKDRQVAEAGNVSLCFIGVVTFMIVVRLHACVCCVCIVQMLVSD